MFIVNTAALQDAEFLKALDTYPHRETMAKIITLDWDENPIMEISGKITTGSVNVDGSSACRRTCSLTFITTDDNVNKVDWQIKTKYYLAVGMKNFVNDKYPEWIWFPLGMFITTSCSLTNNMQGFSLQLQGRDKMCMLDGSVGGQLFATHDFSREELIHRDGSITYEPLEIPQIVREAIHVYAHEAYENIIINDTEDIAVQLLDYKVSDVDAIIYNVSQDNWKTYVTNIIFSNDLDSNLWHALAEHQNDLYESFHGVEGHDGEGFQVIKYVSYGDTVGYRRTKLVYPGTDNELLINVGGTLTDMLNKITQFMGEFEYFYDVYGRFVFQRKRIYHEIVWNGVLPDGENTTGYFTALAQQAIYDFQNGQIIEGYTNKPNLLAIRNDWSIWGEISGSDNDSKYACHLRYAIDDKPTMYYSMTDGCIYTTLDNLNLESLPEDNDIRQYWEQMKANYLEYIGNYQYFENVEGVIKNALGTIQNKMFPVIKVDWREIIYRMAVDYANARANVEFLRNLNNQMSNPYSCIVNPYVYHGYQGLQGENNNIIDQFIETRDITYTNNNNHLCRLGPESFSYYDESKKKECVISLSDWAANNVERLDNEQREISFQEYCAQFNKIIYFNPCVNYIVKPEETDQESNWDYNDGTEGCALWQFHSSSTTDWLYEYPYFGMRFVTLKRYQEIYQQANISQELGDSLGYYGVMLAIDPVAKRRIANQLIQQWERRMNSHYSIYFADMLAFWPIYYKTKNDLSYRDVPVEMVAAIDYQNTTLVNLNNLMLKGALQSQETVYKSISKLAKITHEEKCTRYVNAATTHLTALNKAQEKLTKIEEQYQLQTEICNPLYKDYYVSAALNEYMSTTENYITQQKTNIENYITKVSNLINPSTGAVYPTLDSITATATNYFNTVNGYYENNSFVPGIVTALAEEQRSKKNTLIIDAYNIWEANNGWNPNYIRYHEESDAISFLAPESMLFWLDFMDISGNSFALSMNDKDLYKQSVAKLDQYKISAIGHRAKVVNDDKIKAIFYRNVPDVLWISPDEDTRIDAQDNISYIRLNLTNGLENNFVLSTQGKSAQEELQILLYDNTYYQDSITISCLPIYYLEPNSRIIVNDDATGIRGEYIIKSYSISLAYDGMMSLNASKASDRVYY